MTQINIGNFILSFIIICLVTFIIYNHKVSNGKLDALTRQIDSLNHSIDVKEQLIQASNVKLARLSDSISMTDTRIKYFQNQLKEINAKYAKIKPTVNATPAEVADFFAKRYNN